MIQNFYGDFHLKVENVIGTAQKAVGERNLGVDPVSAGWYISGFVESSGSSFEVFFR